VTKEVCPNSHYSKSVDVPGWPTSCEILKCVSMDTIPWGHGRGFVNDSDTTDTGRSHVNDNMVNVLRPD